MKIGLAILAAGMLALPPHAQELEQSSAEQSKLEQSKAEQSTVKQLEVLLAKYRAATDKLVATLTEANEELNVRVKALSTDRAEMGIRIAKLEVRLGQRSSRQAYGLLFRGEYKKAVESLNLSVASMQRAHSVDEAMRLSDGAMRELMAVRAAVLARRRR